MATRPSRRLGAVPAAVLVAVAIWEIFATRCQSTTVAGDEDWSEAAKIVRSGYRPGDLIVFAPSWVDPVGRLHLGDLIPVEMASRMDAAKYGRIWELSIRNAVAPDVLGLTPVEQHHLGAVEVRRFERKPVEVITDLDTYAAVGGRLDLVEVGFEPHRCMVVLVPPARPYLRSLLELLDKLEERPRRQMLRAFAPLLPELPSSYGVSAAERDGKWIEIHRLELGSTLAGAFGIADVFTRRDERRDVELIVEIEGERRVETRAPIDRWVPFETRTPRGSHWVRFRLRWEANPGELANAKSVCLDAEARR